jgi:hypothetical protein
MTLVIGRPPTTRQRLAAVFAALIVVLGIGDTVFADPAGPTDYRSEIVSVEPPTPSIAVEILGGDSFVELTAAPGTEVVLDGYDAEPYLWFQTDGTVLENRASRTAYLNESRYGSDVPPDVSADAEPDWVEVGDAGRYAWHDHRAHWMQPIRPAGKSPGDQIVEAVIPMVVDGGDVLVTVSSTWLPEPSPVPLGLGVLAGLTTAAIGIGVGVVGRRAGWRFAVVPLAVLTLVVGWLQFRSLPSETGPRLVWWALPALATAAASVAVWFTRRDRFVASAATLIAGSQLAIWGWIKRDGLTAAIVPTDAPGWLDRATTVAGLVGGAAVAAIALWELFAGSRELPASG